MFSSTRNGKSSFPPSLATSGPWSSFRPKFHSSGIIRVPCGTDHNTSIILYIYIFYVYINIYSIHISNHIKTLMVTASSFSSFSFDSAHTPPTISPMQVRHRRQVTEARCLGAPSGFQCPLGTGIHHQVQRQDRGSFTHTATEGAAFKPRMSWAFLNLI